jgi:hypothetical protein
MSDGAVRSVVVYGGDVYSACYNGTLWKNDSILYNLGTGNEFKALCIYNGDIYVAGQVSDCGLTLRAVVWKNGKATILTTGNGSANSIFVDTVGSSAGNVGIVGANNYSPLPKIYPNPTTGQLTINKEINSLANIEIYNIAGQVVGAYRIRPENTETTIDISHLANGLYFLKIDNKMYKIIKE